ncbi:MAG: oligosaccharide flippase family protein [Bacteroidales bacterium]|nr:oligosaccharide flippase family protein [Bacteroidales bacterium]
MTANPLKQLAGQTAIYGVSTVLGRFLNYLLVPIHTYVFLRAQYGVVTELYAYIAFLMIILTYGMETAYFRYAEKPEKNKDSVYSTVMFSILSTTAGFLLLVFLFGGDLATLVEHGNHSEYIIYIALIVGFDAISAIPLARLRAENKPKRFAIVKLTNIGVNIGLNLLLLLAFPWIIKQDIPLVADFLRLLHSGEPQVGYILLANVFASATQVIMLSPEFKKIKRNISMVLWREMIVYALPLLIFGLAGIMNETLDRILLKYMLPLPHDEAMAQLGIYGACYKISILMTIFIQAYRYAAEPFFFSKASNKDAKEMYAMMMNYFVIAGAVIFLGTMLYLDIIINFINEKYWVGRDVIPILLMANLFLGIFYNLSIWYKLTNKTRFGAYLSIGGALITIALNIYWIPKIGYMGSALATLTCYFAMMVASYFIGRRFYPVAYNIPKILGYISLSVVLFLISDKLNLQMPALKWTVHSFMFLAFLGFVFLMERKQLTKIANS